MKKKVAVALSGGVDSSVACALLLDQGYEVIGVTMQLWTQEGSSSRSFLREVVESARKVSEQLGIRHYVVDCRDVFKDIVIANFCKEYSRGRTPNPCIRCNKYIKFDLLLKQAQTLDAHYIATGHYARVEYDEVLRRYIIKKGVDSKQDQSYVLYSLTQNQLERTLFPLGNYTKQKAREYAREKGLFSIYRESSQDVCFVDGKDYREFLSKYIPEAVRPGPIVTTQGKILGTHRGLPFYTIGQREGLRVSLGRPLYVIRIDAENNRLVVGTSGEVYSSGCKVEDLNLVACHKLTEPIEVMVKIRYRHQPASATVSFGGDSTCLVKFREPQRAVTPGQAAAFYKDDTVIGGGTIVEGY